MRRRAFVMGSLSVAMLAPFMAVGGGVLDDIALTRREADLLVKTIYGEAAGEGPAGWIGVAHVIRRRVENPRWWGKDVETVIFAPKQFSVWDGPETAMRLDMLDLTRPIPQAIRAAVLGVFMGYFADPTNGADHYHSTRIAPPTWARQKPPVAVIGQHLFYRLET